MERTVPSTASEEIELYQRTYYSLLRSSAEVHIRSLEEAHTRMASLLHPAARAVTPDMTAFVYVMLRLPACIMQTQLVILGQSLQVFAQYGYGGLEGWQQVSALARRRRCYYNEKDILACFIASRSDIDDVIPLLTAFQIEWNKIHILLQSLPAPGVCELSFQAIAESLQVSEEDLEKLRAIWGDQFNTNLAAIAAEPKRLRVRLLSGSLSEYWRATRIWWENIQEHFPNIRSRPLYFISSNPHSVINLLTGFALQNEDELVEFLHQKENRQLLSEWEKIDSERVPSSRENFLYYVLKKYQQSLPLKDVESRLLDCEQSLGVVRIFSLHSFDVEAQVIELSRLDPALLDPRLGNDLSYLAESDALILNIDYPLGLAAYNILSKVAEHVESILGVYITGKAATLNGVIGDIMIPNVVQDEQSRNTFLFANVFTAAEVSPLVTYGTVLDNQKAVSVRGTFLQNVHYMDVFYREGYTDIEMEAGPYLSAVYEMYRPQRHPVDEVVNLYGLPFDLGILHYASDTPLSKGKNLGSASLSYFGMDATYGVSLAILRRIFHQERQRLQTQRNPRG